MRRKREEEGEDQSQRVSISYSSMCGGISSSQPPLELSQFLHAWLAAGCPIARQPLDWGEIQPARERE